jgi:hypothetical protein
MNQDDVVTGGEAFDRLTELCAEMTSAIERPDTQDVRGIVFLSDDKLGGIQMFGYEDQVEAMADLFVHMRSIFKSMGKNLEFVGIPESPEGLT